MSGPPKASGERVESKDQLVDYLAAGCKPAPDWRIGTEHEKFTIQSTNHRPQTYKQKGRLRDHYNGIKQR